MEKVKNFFQDIRKPTNEEIENQEGEWGRKEYGPPSLIKNYLLLASHYNVIDEETLLSHKVTHILNVAEELQSDESRHKSRKYKKLVIQDLLPTDDHKHPEVIEQFSLFEDAF